MSQIFWGIIKESADLFIQMSPYLLMGLLFAGLFHIFIPLGWVARHLGPDKVGSVLKAVLLGIPLPLCSCSVIPAAVTLKRQGASGGAVASFLVAAPIIGVGAIFATMALMGWIFTLMRLTASVLTAIVAGLLVNLIRTQRLRRSGEMDAKSGAEAPCCRFHQAQGDDAAPPLTKSQKIAELFRYAFLELLDDIWRWLVLGVLIGGLISAVFPQAIVERYLGSPGLSMLIMLAVAVPMYICATGSIPIVAALMMKGMSPGAGLVFLLAGPATNAVTITVIVNQLGKATATLYVGSIVVMSLLMGLALDGLWGMWRLPSFEHEHGMPLLPHWVHLASALVLSLIIAYLAARRFRHKQGEMIGSSRASS